MQSFDSSWNCCINNWIWFEIVENMKINFDFLAIEYILAYYYACQLYQTLFFSIFFHWFRGNLSRAELNTNNDWFISASSIQIKCVLYRNEQQFNRFECNIRRSLLHHDLQCAFVICLCSMWCWSLCLFFTINWYTIRLPFERSFTTS